MRSFENWFGIPLRFFALAIFLSSPKRSFDSIFKVLKLFRTKRVRLSVNTNIHAKPLTHACVCVCVRLHSPSLALSLCLYRFRLPALFSIFCSTSLSFHSFNRSLTHSLIIIIIFGVETCMGVWVWCRCRYLYLYAQWHWQCSLFSYMRCVAPS